MTPLDDYVRRVKFWLPGVRGRMAAEDVRATLEDLLAERERRIGRPLEPAEVADELRAFGRPEVIASRYSTMRPLIDAGLMPAYARVLGVAVAGVLAAQLVLALGAPAPETGETIVRTGGRIVTGLLWSFTSVTVAFACLTRLYTPARSGAGGAAC